MEAADFLRKNRGHSYFFLAILADHENATPANSFDSLPKLICLSLIALLTAGLSIAVRDRPIVAPQKFSQQDKFRQLEEILPTPNAARTASGAPAQGYWQQQVDYEIDVRIDEETQRLTGSEAITYTNNSPDTLRYLWLQLDANIHRPDSDANLTRTTDEDLNRMPFRAMKSLLAKEDFDGAIEITKCVDSQTNRPLQHTIVKTMMRVDLPAPLEPGESFKFEIDWNYEINNARVDPRPQRI